MVLDFPCWALANTWLCGCWDFQWTAVRSAAGGEQATTAVWLVALGTLEAQTALVDEPPDIAGNNQLPHPPIFGGEWQTDCYLDTYVDYPPPARMTAGR